MMNKALTLSLVLVLSASPVLSVEETEQRAPRLTLASGAEFSPAASPANAAAAAMAPVEPAAVAAEPAVAEAAQASAPEEPAKEPRSPRLEFSSDLPVLDFPDTEVSLQLKDMDIVEALKFIAEKAGINIIPTREVQGRVSLDVDNVSVKDVFTIVLRSNNLAYEKKGNIYNVMTETEFKGRYGKNFYDSRVTRVFRLQYAVPDQAFNVLSTLKSEIGKVLLDADSGVILVMDTPERVREMDATLQAMDQKGIIKVFSLKYARAKDVEDQLKNQLDIKKVGTVRSDERTNQVIVQTLPERMEDVARLIQGLDQKTRQILIDAKIVQVKLNNQLSSGVQWEGLFDIGGKNGDLSYLGSYPFSSVDSSTTATWRSRSQVYSDNGRNVGSYPFSGTTSNIAGGSKKLLTEEMHVGVVSGNKDFDAVLKYLQTLGETRILSNPKLAVVNNQEAKIHVGERRAYITTTTTQTQTSTTVAEAVTYVDVGIQLMVTPTINEDGFVTVKIKPEISSVIDYLKTSSANSIPIIDTSTAETIVMVKDGTSLLIGGLSKEDKTLDETGTPFLSKIPLIGEAFKTSTKKTVRYELMVLLTPHIVSGDELVTGYDHDLGYKLDKEYQKYQGFKEAEDTAGFKSYQTYPGPDTGRVPGIKPEQNL